MKNRWIMGKGVRAHRQWIDRRTLGVLIFNGAVELVKLVEALLQRVRVRLAVGHGDVIHGVLLPVRRLQIAVGGAARLHHHGRGGGQSSESGLRARGAAEGHGFGAQEMIG